MNNASQTIPVSDQTADSPRPALEDDVNALIALGRLFGKEAQESVDRESLEDLFLGLMGSENGFLFIEGDYAMLGAVAFPFYFDLSRMIVSEMFWYVKPEYRGSGAGKRLVDQLESWAKEIGASRICMQAYHSSEGVGAFYEREGYRVLETNYVKDL